MKKKSEANKKRRSTTVGSGRPVRVKRQKVSELYELAATTSLVPYMADIERHQSLTEALRRRKELKIKFKYVSLTKVTEIREEIRAASEP